MMGAGLEEAVRIVGKGAAAESRLGRPGTARNRGGSGRGLQPRCQERRVSAVKVTRMLAGPAYWDSKDVRSRPVDRTQAASMISAMDPLGTAV